jgi:single-strand DNA-binding protein
VILRHEPPAPSDNNPQEDAMTDTITLTGLVATSPRHIVTSEGLAITSFRLASNQRRFDRATGGWVDGDTNWYTITCFRQLGTHVAGSVHKGERVIVTGRVRIRDWSNDEKSGTTIEIDAESMGHDLAWGRANYVRSIVGSRDGPNAEHSGSPSSDAERTSASSLPGSSGFSEPAAAAPF